MTKRTMSPLPLPSSPWNLRHRRAAQVPCTGVNACKGQSACKSAANACKGENACKGKGFVNAGSTVECTVLKTK